MPDEAKIAAAPRKRILSLDGGGVRGVFTIEILARIEALLRDELGQPGLVLADHFHFMAGTSTGAIIATLLSWGEPVAHIRQLYQDHCVHIFPPIAPWKVWRAGKILRHLPRAWFSEEPLIAFFREHFKERTTTREALLGSDHLKTYLLLCLRNSTTGSAWPMTNNPKARYNLRTAENDYSSNLDLALWKLVRASTAAPIYFLPELIDVGNFHFAFIDGGLTPYNNPALIAYLTATQPCYNLGWPNGIEKLHIVSIGTCRVRNLVKDLSFWNANMFNGLLNVPSWLMDSINMQQDFLCRVLGSCLYGHTIDSEVGSLLPAEGKPDPSKHFTYVRYDYELAGPQLADARKKYGKLDLGNTRAMPLFSELGQETSKRVRLEHLL
jgi:uncharacterized protein